MTTDTIDIESIVKIRDRVQSIETSLLEKFNIATRHIDDEEISSIIIVSKAQLKSERVTSY
jgi:hypothetical protein